MRKYKLNEVRQDDDSNSQLVVFRGTDIMPRCCKTPVSFILLSMRIHCTFDKYDYTFCTHCLDHKLMNFDAE
ncbi:hypothetical protein O9929_01480 [Vibrio lentus]|nr:hypothetical protein [Vibrio lentus]